MNLVQDVVGLLEERKIGGRNLFMNNGLINKLTFPKKTFKYQLVINDSNINHTIQYSIIVLPFKNIPCNPKICVTPKSSIKNYCSYNKDLFSAKNSNKQNLREETTTYYRQHTRFVQCFHKRNYVFSILRPDQ